MAEITFGKHKGREVNEAPRSYLRWCLDNIPHIVEGHGLTTDFQLALGLDVQELKSELAAAWKRQEEYRHRINQLENELEMTKEEYVMAQRQVWEFEKKAGDTQHVYRELSKRFHPDKGGNHEDMVFINQLFGR